MRSRRTHGPRGHGLASSLVTLSALVLILITGAVFLALASVLGT